MSDTDKNDAPINDPRLWRADGWTARVIKNEDDDGWAVSMTRDGDPEPALTGPWTMGRDKKNPKPLDQNAFLTLVKTASEVLERHAHQRRAQLHKSADVQRASGETLRVEFDIVPDEDDPHAFMTVFDPSGDVVKRARMEAHFKFTQATATRWVEQNL